MSKTITEEVKGSMKNNSETPTLPIHRFRRCPVEVLRRPTQSPYPLVTQVSRPSSVRYLQPLAMSDVTVSELAKSEGMLRNPSSSMRVGEVTDRYHPVKRSRSLGARSRFHLAPTVASKKNPSGAPIEGDMLLICNFVSS